MPSRPLSANTWVVVKLQTWIDAEAIDVTESRTDMRSAVARLVQLVPPTRVDLVDQVLVRLDRRGPDQVECPPIQLVQQLAYRVKRVHLGEVRMSGPNGEVVDLVRYTDKLGYDRRVYRLHRLGRFVGEYKTSEELGEVVDLAELVEDDETGHAG